jgi:hypothetical protein
MKKLLAILCLFIISASTRSQTMSFSMYNSPYAFSTNTSIITSLGWSAGEVFTLPLGFTFHFYGQPFTTFYTTSSWGGFIYNGVTFVDYNFDFIGAALRERIGGVSHMRAGTEGIAPNRIFKLDIRKAGFLGDAGLDDEIDLQVWLYETSDVVEIHYGYNSVFNNASWQLSNCFGPNIMMYKNSTNYLMLTGSSANPVAVTSGAYTCITGAPATGTVYRFTPHTAGIEEIGNLKFDVFPNPAEGTFRIRSDDYNSEFHIEVYNSLGKLIYNEKCNAINSKELDMSLAPDIYLLKIQSDKKSGLKRLVVI